LGLRVSSSHWPADDGPAIAASGKGASPTLVRVRVRVRVRVGDRVTVRSQSHLG
jgi:hypothetical protein